MTACLNELTIVPNDDSNVPTMGAEEVLNLVRACTFLAPADFHDVVKPVMDQILHVMTTPEFNQLAQRHTNWEFLYEIRCKQSKITHYILGSNHGIDQERTSGTEDQIVDMVHKGMVTHAWTEIDPETALPKTFDMRIVKRVNHLNAVFPMETAALHDQILDNLSDLLVDRVRATIDTMTEMVKGLNEIVAELFICGNAHLNWFMYRLSWMILMGKMRYQDHEEVLLQNRNLRWTNRVIPKITTAREPHIIVCGCNHLFGHKGMLQLFKRQGWEFKPVRIPLDRVDPVSIPFERFSVILRRIQRENEQNARLDDMDSWTTTKWPDLTASLSLILLSILTVASLLWYIMI